MHRDILVMRLAAITFGIYFYTSSGKVKLKNKNDRHGVVPVCARFFLLSVGYSPFVGYLTGRW